MRRPRSSGGFTLVESLVALAIGGAFLTSVLSAWFFSTKTWNQENLHSKLRYQIERSMEKLKADVRLSDGNNIVFYPAADPTYTAISLPSSTLDSNGLRTIGSTGITWNRTVIYHTYVSGGTTQLRRTIVGTYDTNATNRQTQLDNCVATGTVTGATTTTLFSSPSLTFEMAPTAPTFDGYAASTEQSAVTSFGSIRLSAGTHSIRFEVTGQNTLSSGYRMGLDWLALTPSGGSQEAEALPVIADSGRSRTSEDMTAYGVWNGNYQVEYQSLAVADYITYQTNYDQWLESNFSDMTHSNTSISGTDPVLTIASRETQSLSPAWQATAQTAAGGTTSAAMGGSSYRNVVSGTSITKAGNMIRFKFIAPSGGSLVIDKAYFGPRNGTSADIVGAPTQLYFDNDPVAVTSPDPVGETANPGTRVGLSVSADHHVWTNWIPYDVSLPASDLLVSVYCSSGDGMVSQDTTTIPAPTNSYNLVGDQAATATWSTLLPAPAENRDIYALESMAAWLGSGSATSQVYDTQVTSPVYDTLSWSPTLPSGASISMKIRTSANSDMSGATAWSGLTAHTTSPASLSGLSNQRYVQFQATLDAASPWVTLPELDDVKVTWPGEDALVTLSGQFTKRPNYGIFKITVDGNDVVQALSIYLESSETYQDQTFTHELTAEGRPRNTGK